MPAIFDPPLSTQRYMWVEQFLNERPHITSMTDVGCGNGRMVNWTKTVPTLELINCLDADINMLEYEMDRYLRPNLLERLFGRKNSDKEVFINVYQGDIAVPDDRLNSDCFTLIEMIEHITPEHVEKISKTIFGYYQPKYVVVSTPNSEFNHLLEEHDKQNGNGSSGASSSSLPQTKPRDPNNKFRHFDHKFEWTRAEFNQWAQYICSNFNYEYQVDGVGHMPGKSEPFGPCTQIAIFTRKSLEPVPVEESSLICFDLLLNKLSVEETDVEWNGDNKKRRICLLASFSVPGNTHLQVEYQHDPSAGWDVEYPVPLVTPGQSSSSQEEPASQENDDYSWDQNEDDSFDQNDNEDCDMEEFDEQQQQQQQQEQVQQPYEIYDLTPW